MAETPTPEEIKKWHRWFGVECNNQTWALADKEARSPDEDRLMKLLAYSSLYHWSQVGTLVNVARGEVNLAHVHSLLGEGQEAQQFAQSALATFEAGDGEDWDLAFALLECAQAARVTGQMDLYSDFYNRTKTQVNEVKEKEDREIVQSYLDKLPPP
jgi:hypothetical protein